MELRTFAGHLALALSTIAILFVLREKAPHCRLHQHAAKSTADDHLRQLYLHTVKHSVTGVLLQTPGYSNFAPMAQLKKAPYNHAKRSVGADWPVTGEHSVLGSGFCCMSWSGVT
jgi:hypothetical protein